MRSGEFRQSRAYAHRIALKSVPLPVVGEPGSSTTSGASRESDFAAKLPSIPLGYKTSPTCRSEPAFGDSRLFRNRDAIPGVVGVEAPQVTETPLPRARGEVGGQALRSTSQHVLREQSEP
jgi:hypothetical protein